MLGQNSLAVLGFTTSLARDLYGIGEYQRALQEEQKSIDLYKNLFKDHEVFQGVLVADGILDIAEGPALDDGAILIRGMHSEDIYLMDKGRKRIISSARIMDKYGFDEASVTVVPQILVNSVPTGEVWE